MAGTARRRRTRPRRLIHDHTGTTPRTARAPSGEYAGRHAFVVRRESRVPRAVPVQVPAPTSHRLSWCSRTVIRAGPRADAAVPLA